MKFRTKLFVEERIVRRPPGAAPTQWDALKQSDPIDRQMDLFLAVSRGHPALVSAPSFTMTWLDREMTTQRIMIGVILTYIPPEGSHEPPADADPWPEFVPSAADGLQPAGGDAAGPA